MSYILPIEVSVGVAGVRRFPKLIQKESFTAKFIFKDSKGELVDVSSAVFTFYLKLNKAADAVATIADVDFDKTNAASGIVTVKLTPTHLDRYGYYLGLLKTVLDADTTDKAYFDIELEESSE